MSHSYQKNVLVCGGSGLVGTHLCDFLQEQGYVCTSFTHSPKRHKPPESLYWDPPSGYLDESVLGKADIIVNLSGAGLAERLWSTKRKKSIIESRVQSTRFLYSALKKLGHKPSLFIQASAIGFYGTTEKEPAVEDNPAAKNDFLATVTSAWEQEAYPISSALGIRTMILRMGMVLSAKGGALPHFVNPVRFFLGSPLGSGQQVVGWIHIQDLCQLILMAIQDKKWRGVYNAVSPEAITNRELVFAIASILGKPILMPKVPAFVLRVLLGEMSSLILQGRRVSAAKLLRNDFVFRYPSIKSALQDILTSK